MGSIIKNFCNFEQKINFDFVSDLLDRNNLKSKISSNYLNDFIFESVFKIENIENDYVFKNIFDLLNRNFNIENKKSDLFLFLSFVSGNKSITHKDEYDVYILELFGKTMYKIEKEEFILEPNDLLFIPKNKIHKAIGLTPRICLSYAIY